jgi:hypothetical protein
VPDEPVAASPEVLPAIQAAPKPKASPPAPKPNWLLTIWWGLKKLAWRNTAAALWILLGLVWARRLGLGGPTFEDFLALGLSAPPRAVGVGVALWLLIICELQLTQVILFAVYAVTLPLWLPIYGIRRYLKGRFAGSTRKSIPFKIRPLRLSIALVILATVFWWPLPNPRIALIVGVLALIPGLYLARLTFKFAIAPATWMRDFRARVHKAYENLKKQPVAANTGDDETRRQGEAIRRWMINFYESILPKSIERGLLRILAISYFCLLLASCLVYLGFLGALWLRGLTGTPEQLAMAIGRTDLPNLVHFTAICALGVLGEWKIDASVLPPAAAGVVYVLNIARVVTGLILITVFFSNYSADIRRFEGDPTGTEQPVAGGGPGQAA